MKCRTLRWLLIATLVVVQCCRCAPVNYISTGDYSKDGYAFDGDYFNFDRIPLVKSSTVTCTLINPTVKGGGAYFYRYGPLNADYSALNVTVRGATVTNAPITVYGNYSNLRMEISGTLATMQGTTNLYVFDTFYPYINSIVNILQTTVTWPSDAVGGSVFMLTGDQYLHLDVVSAFYLTWTHATNPAQIWYLHPTAGWLGWSTGYPYYVNIAGAVALDYTTCVNCRVAFLNADPGVAPFAGSKGAVFRISNSTMIGKPNSVFWKSSNVEMFGLGGYWANLVLSGITTNCPLFLSGSSGFLQGSASLTLTHINVPAIGLASSDPLFPKYTYAGVSDNDAFMGNITVDGVLLSPSFDVYHSYQLDPTVLVDNYSIVDADSGRGRNKYSVGSPSAAYCTVVQYTGASFETLGPQGKQWKRAQCDCVSGGWKPYCTRSYDPMLYYAGYTFNPPPCTVEDCASCLWGYTEVCNRCEPGFMLSERYKCVPNLCGVCPEEKGKTLFYYNGTCLDCNVEGCVACVANNTCSSCSSSTDSLSLVDGSCVKCNVENCAHCSSENVCSDCNTDQNYTKMDGKCVYCPAECGTCDTTGACTSCPEGYMLTEAGGCTSSCTVLNCETCGSPQVCTTCKTGFVASNGKCQCDVDNCVLCHNEYCQQCMSGFKYVYANNTCSPNAVSGPVSVCVSIFIATLFFFGCALL